MVRRQLARRGIADRNVLAAMQAVPRERFVPPAMADHAYSDCALPIGEGQTITQPYVVALMAEALELSPGDRVLEVGAGSGYAAAVLAQIAAAVYTVERRATLARDARARLSGLACENVRVRHGDGTLGWREHAPFDAIAVAAAGPQVPAALREQLRVGGRLVAPVGPAHGTQRLIRERRRAAAEFRRDELATVRFVPLVASPAGTVSVPGMDAAPVGLNRRRPRGSPPTTPA